MDREHLISKYPAHPGNLIMILHAIQNDRPQHFISRADMRSVARYLNITLSAVYGVVHYYSMFSDVPRGRHVIRICQSPVCRMMGTAAVAARLEDLLGVPAGAVTADGRFSFETVECLGHCDRAPAMMLDEAVHGELTPAKLKAVIAALRRSPGE
jgi:NADH:ubiquinone oxidoreductase subunit E